jgi:hypothetical protein
MFYVHEVRNLCVLAIFERRRGRLGSKISGCGQLAEVAVYFAMSGLPPEADTKRKGRHVRWVPIVLKNSKIAGHRKSRKCSASAISAAARSCRIDTKASDRFCGN